jgi:hypothetical protein
MKTRHALFVLALSACGGDAPPALGVGPVTYTHEQLLGLSPARVETLAHLTAFGMAVADSSTAALGAPLVARWEDDRLLELLAAELTLEKNGVGDDVLAARYRTDPELELTVRHILFFSERWRTPQERAAAKAKADRALEAIREGADFAETAARLSEEPGAMGRQGLLTPGREGAWVDEFWAAASALDVGDISPVTETEYGYHILRLEEQDTVPFAEARSRVAVEVADRIEDPEAVLEVWVDEHARSLRVRPVAGAGAAGATASPVADTAVLASWGGEETVEGAITGEAWAAWAMTEPPTAKATEAAVRALARRRLALDEVERRGLAVSPAYRARLERRWGDQVYQWSATLGFYAGGGPDAVARAALAALGGTGQGAGLARSAVDRHARLLEAHYPVHLPEPSG